MRIDFAALEESLAPITTVLHAGDVLDFGDIRFDILREVNENILKNTGNNASLTFSVTVAGQRIVCLGDAGIEAGEELRRQNPPDAVRADIVHTAHHGQNGVAMDVYIAIQPRACLWSTPEWLWCNDDGNGYGAGPWKTLITRCYLGDLGVRRHCVQKDGIWDIPLFLALD